MDSDRVFGSAFFSSALITSPLVTLLSLDATIELTRSHHRPTYGSPNLPSQKVKDLILDQAKS
ncbi:MAG: hypothetical protein ACYSTF_02260 [Planctomycetota bacterium]